MKFQKAIRPRVKLRLALCGPSGSGKTYSALLIAKGLGGRVAVIDTQYGQASLYADNATIGLEYDVLELSEPYTPARFVEALQLAAKDGYDVAVIDSITHAWSGEGGLLDMVQAASKNVRDNTWAAWKAIKPHEKKFLSALLGTDIHVIATIRSKTAWAVETDSETGKSRPVKLGLKPEQREGIEYEFMLVFDLSVDGHVAHVSTDRISLFGEKDFVPTIETGQRLVTWLESGEEIAAVQRKAKTTSVNADIEKMINFWGRHGILPEQIEAKFGKSMAELDETDMSKLRDMAKGIQRGAKMEGLFEKGGKDGA